MTQVRFMSRAQWGGGPKRRGRHVSGIRGLVIHHTVFRTNKRYSWADAASYMRTLQNLRPDLGSEVPYSFVVFTGFNGTVIVAEGRGANWSGAHTIGYNSTRYGVALPGNMEHETPSVAQLDGINWIGRTYVGASGARTMGHYEVSSTACPGQNMRLRIGRVQPPYAGGGTTTTPTPPPPAPKDWFDMASKTELREIIREELDHPRTERPAKTYGRDYIKDAVEPALNELRGFTIPAFVKRKGGGPLWVTNWLVKVDVKEGSAHHNLLAYLISVNGGSTSVHPIEDEALDAIPTVTSS